MSNQTLSPEIGNQELGNIVRLDDWRETPADLVIYNDREVRRTGHSVCVDDGSRYDVHVFEPNYLRFDTAIAFTTPWFTDLSGFNDRLGQSLAEQGMTSIVISPERLTLSSFRHLMNFGELKHDAASALAILDELEQPERGLQIEPGRTILTGYSRGGMVGIGMNELAAKTKRSIPYSYFVDPVLEHAVSLDDIRKEGPMQYLKHETQSLLGNLPHNSPREWADVPKTVMGVLRNFAGNLAVTPHLFTGEAGQFKPPRSMTALMQLYASSSLNHHESWQKKFLRYPNVRMQILSGNHMSGGDPHARKWTVDHLEGIQRLLQENAEPSDLLDTAG